MVSIHELSYRGGPEGWKHLSRLANCRSSLKGLPEDSIDFFVDFAKSMLELYDQLGDADRGDYNKQIIESTARQLKITKKAKGPVALKDMSSGEFSKSVAGQQAAMVENLLRQDAFLTKKEAIEAITDKYTNNDRTVDQRTIERAWKVANERPRAKVKMSLWRSHRDLARAEFLAYSLAKGPPLKKIRFSVKLPNLIRKHFPDIGADTEIVIATREPQGKISDPDCFHFDPQEEQEEPLRNTYAYFAHVLAQTITLDEESFTLEQWDGWPLVFSIFIAEQFLAKLERRKPRKTWL